ncbi:MAG TPA: polyphosphate kinase 1 [Methylomirabilota bacterium]|nr:polyphosphate kinase 1 [Methylomirabilota bacterium]
MSSTGAAQFLNRELSWLEFNRRVLAEAQDPNVPLLERVKFFSIFSSNLDEFFEVRVAGIQQQIESDVVDRSVDGLTATERFQAIQKRVHELVDEQYICWREQLVPDLAKCGIRFLNFEQVNEPDLKWLKEYYLAQVRPVLTPLAIDPAHPFPQLLNKSLNMIVQLEMQQGGRTLQHLAVVQVPRVLPRLVRLPREREGADFVFMGQIIGHFLADLFPGTTILGYCHFRVTRNSELYIDEEDIENLLKAVENELHNRRKGDAVRLEVEHKCPPEIRKALLGTLRLEEEDLYLIDGPLNPTRLMAIYHGDHSPELRDQPFFPSIASPLKGQRDLFAAIAEGDILLHHPYESFNSVVEFLEQAAEDPKVLAIKQTLYRTGGDVRITGALMNAVKNGKQVTAVVELRARFDEANNIHWSRQLEEAGVHVVYGLVGYKIHGKISLVVRSEEGGIRRYVHLSTGNYNPTTAKLYTDLGFFTCRPDFGEDATNLFNLLTGIGQFQEMRKFFVAPFELQERMVALIDRETENAKKKLPARIILKLNSLVEPQTIEALYRASQAGVKIDLIIRGICCLRPGVKGMSTNIAVRSIVDRFLEHTRIAYFENGGEPQIFVMSADWMRRNFFRRLEIAFPIEDPALRKRICNEIFPIMLADNVKAWLLQPDGSYVRAQAAKGEKPIRSQMEFIALAEASASAKTQRKKTTRARRFPLVELAPNPWK